MIEIAVDCFSYYRSSKDMRKLILPRRSHLTNPTLLVLTSLALVQSAFGVITVHFVETGPDLVVSFNGSISVAPIVVYNHSPDTNGGYVREGTVNARNGVNAVYTTHIGAASNVPFHRYFNNTPTPDDVGIFGYNSDYIIFQAMHITGYSASSVSEITGITEISATPATASFTFPGAALSSINAEGIAEGAVLWTENTTGDTFVFSRLAPVPEPSSLLLCGLCAAGIFFRTRR